MNQTTQKTHPKGAYKQAKKPRFLMAYKQIGSISGAAEAVGISREVVYDWRQNDCSFAEAIRQADDEVTDRLEEEALKRALTKSDAVLMFLLKARRPEKYRELPNRIQPPQIANPLRNIPTSDLLIAVGVNPIEVKRMSPHFSNS